MRKGFLLVIILLAFVTACGGANTEIAPAAPQSSPPAASTEPAAVAASTQKPPGDNHPSPSVMTTIPAPDEETGVVIGTIFSTKMNAPLSQMGVYLGDYMYLTPGPGYMITMTQKGSPNTVADSEGRFAIGKVKPGDYPLLLWTPFSSHVVSEAESTEDLVVTVKAGEVTDLGEIRVEWP